MPNSNSESESASKSRPPPVRKARTRKARTVKTNEASGEKKRRARALTADRRSEFTSILASKPPRPPPIRKARTVKTSNEPHHQYGLLSGSPKPRKKPVRKPKSLVTNVGNPYSINMVMNNPVIQSRPKPVRPPSRRRQGTVSLNDVNRPHVPERSLTLNQVAFPAFNLNKEIQKAQKEAEWFKTTLQMRKSKTRSAKGSKV